MHHPHAQAQGVNGRTSYTAEKALGPPPRNKCKQNWALGPSNLPLPGLSAHSRRHLCICIPCSYTKNGLPYATSMVVQGHPAPAAFAAALPGLKGAVLGRGPDSQAESDLVHEVRKVID